MSEPSRRGFHVTTRMPFSASLARIRFKYRRTESKFKMSVKMNVGRRRVGALLKARVRQPVHHHMVVRSHQAFDDAIAGSPAGRIEDGMLLLGIVRVGIVVDFRLA